jgi:hypothetical protein
METVAYKAYLQGQGIPDDAIEEQMAVIEDFAGFLSRSGSNESAAREKEVVEKFAHTLIAAGRNTLKNFSALRNYADWLGNRPLYVAWVEVMDCHNALEVLADEIEKRHGRVIRDQLFHETWPSLGADEIERCAYTRTLSEQMAQQFTSEETRAAWFQVQHGIPAHAWRQSDVADKEKFQQCGDIDEFLSLKRKERDRLLTRLRDENQLWYTVEITDEVLEFVKRDPEIEAGQREGDKIYITKIPYNADLYLHETDPKMKRYYACHCPLVRQAILQDRPISADICDCSLGHASHYLAGLDQELRGEVLESALKGDTRCRFVFYLATEIK